MTGPTANMPLAVIQSPPGTQIVFIEPNAVEGRRTRQSAQATTRRLVPGATDSATTIALSSGYRLYSIAVSRPARVRLYETAPQRDADLARPVGVDPGSGVGVVFDFVALTSDVCMLSPLVEGADMGSSPVGRITMAVTNYDTVAGAVTVSLVFLRCE